MQLQRGAPATISHFTLINQTAQRIQLHTKLLTFLAMILFQLLSSNRQHHLLEDGAAYTFQITTDMLDFKQSVKPYQQRHPHHST